MVPESEWMAIVNPPRSKSDKIGRGGPVGWNGQQESTREPSGD